MCTTIATSLSVRGAGKGGDGWFAVTRCTVGYDHPVHVADEHAVLIDFANYDLGTAARVAVELDLGSARLLLAHLQEAVDRAEALEAPQPT
ncbi:MAG TPA: DUF6295 family protein [Acidimicrobiales bacterium]|nr:DUF6295 family protein [Acidimicrobiales bacterium]